MVSYRRQQFGRQSVESLMMTFGFFKQFAISIGVSLVILILCLMPSPELEIELPMTNFDKLVHFGMFAVLAAAVFYDNSRRLKQRVCRTSLWLGSVAYPMLMGGVIELMQEYMTASRNGDWMDFLFDDVGIVFAAICIVLINRRIK